jgi:hypothetical protein
MTYLFLPINTAHVIGILHIVVNIFFFASEILLDIHNEPMLYT